MERWSHKLSTQTLSLQLQSDDITASSDPVENKAAGPQSYANPAFATHGSVLLP